MRQFNFSPGPAQLPEPVLDAVLRNLQSDYPFETFLECSHRGKKCLEMVETASLRLRRLLGVPEDFECLMLSGGARAQFGFIAQHLLGPAAQAAYLVSGHWSEMAFQEAQQLCPDADIRSYPWLANASVQAPNGDEFKPPAIEALLGDTFNHCQYLYYCSNETVDGIFAIPQVNRRCLVADMTSSIMTHAIDFDSHGIIFASAQKNLGIAGITLVLIHKDWLRPPARPVPSVFQYAIQAKAQSMANTPCVFAWHVMNEVLGWVESSGGLMTMAAETQAKAKRLYAFLDQHPAFHNPLPPSIQSPLSVVFDIHDSTKLVELTEFLTSQGCLNVKGHRKRGGLRASNYIGMPMAGIEQLIDALSAYAADVKWPGP